MNGAKVLAIEPFLTAYDPSDLPGSSIDPLGFDRGYAFLAESILPGLTNVANHPRYLSVLCAALSISDDAASGAETGRQRLARRRNDVLLLERLWVLACIRAAKASDGRLRASGIRGLRYVEREIARQGSRVEKTAGDYKLLARQAQYGLLGIYSNVAERLRLLTGELELHPEFGRRLAEAFIGETELPKSVRRCLTERQPVPLKELESWGERAHHSLVGGEEETRVLREAFERSPVRQRMGRLLEQVERKPGQSELDRLSAIRDRIEGEPEQRDLRDALDAAGKYEACFKAATLAFQALLWAVEREKGLDLTRAAQKDGVATAYELLRCGVPRLDHALTGSQHLIREAGRWHDVLSFLKEASLASSGEAFVVTVLKRHGDVQRGKFDRGRQKAPWLELNGRAIRLTLSQAQRVLKEPRTPRDVAPHEYRTLAADRLLGRNVG